MFQVENQEKNPKTLIEKKFHYEGKKEQLGKKSMRML